MQLIIINLTTGENIGIEIESYETISRLKEKISEKIHVPVNKLTIHVLGQNVTNNKTLEQLNIKRNKRVFIGVKVNTSSGGKLKKKPSKHKIYTGQRGGRYYIKNNRKVYI
tara:strand:- start:300 stop:632 length:333 start_codon:yes stop_codon:yes gene_type:complete